MRSILASLVVVAMASAGAAVGIGGPSYAHGQPRKGAQLGPRAVYVSSSTGRDSNTGLSPGAPKRTLAQGYALIRDGRGDRLLLKRGDRFKETLAWSKSGASRGLPARISSYGNGPRPILEATDGDSLVLTPGYRATKPLRHVSVSNLHFYAKDRDPKRAGADPKTKPTAIVLVGTEIKARYVAEDIEIEDVRIEAYGNGMNLMGGGASGGAKDVRVRRVQILDSYSVQGHMHGMYVAEIHGFLLEDSLIDNTQRAKLPGVQAKTLDHSIYVQSTSSDVTIRGNVLSRGPDGCMQRPGGVFEDNLVIDMEFGGSNQGLIWGGTTPVKGGISTLVRRNAFIGIDRGFGLMLGNIRTGEIRDNIFLGNDAGQAIALYGTTNLDNVGVHDLRIEENVAIGVQALVFHHETFSDIQVRNNVFRGARKLVNHAFFDASTFRYEGNRYAALTTDSSFDVGQKAMDPKGWAEKVGEPLRFEKLAKPPRAPGLAHYMRDVVGKRSVGKKSVGKNGGVEAFLQGARDPNRSMRNDDFMARNVVDYLRKRLASTRDRGVPTGKSAD